MNDNGDGPPALPEALQGVLTQLHELTPQIEQGLSEIEEERRTIAQAYREKLAQLDQQERYLKGILTRLSPRSPAKKRKSSARPVGSQPMATIIKAALEQGDALFSPIVLHRQRGWSWSEPHTYQATAYLRAEEIFGLAGKDRAGPHSRRVFRMLDRERAEQMLKDLEQTKAWTQRKQGQDDAKESKESISG